jgi:hypothetical protein
MASKESKDAYKGKILQISEYFPIIDILEVTEVLVTLLTYC